MTEHQLSSPDKASPSSVLERVASNRNSDVGHIWQSLFEKIGRYAERRIQQYPRGQIDNQDITASVFASLIRGCREGRFHDVSDYDECLRLLQAMAKRKIVDRIRYLTRIKRGGLANRVESIDELSKDEIANACDEELQPEAIAVLKEVIEDSIRHLNDHLRPVVGLRLQGYEHQEIAEILEVSTSTVARKLRLVREMWKQQLLEDSSHSPS